MKIAPDIKYQHHSPQKKPQSGIFMLSNVFLHELDANSNSLQHLPIERIKIKDKETSYPDTVSRPRRNNLQGNMLLN